MDETQDLTKIHSKRLGRELAMQYLFRCDMRGELPDLDKWQEFFEEQLKEEHQLRDNRYSRKGREFAESLVVGIGIHLDEVDEKVKAFAKNWEWERISLVDRNIMRVAVYEMLFSPEIPPVVSINEAIEIARDYSDEKSGNFISGVLNGVKDTLTRPAREALK